MIAAQLLRNNAQADQTYFDPHHGQIDKWLVSVMEEKILQASLTNDVKAQADQIESMGYLWTFRTQRLGAISRREMILQD